mmetsp:Transcript_64443/g.153778  ORF Transcript_64443/g.153778 Transcript_64443/m.153778 type:complete len:267 (+) Transcript_64443:3564-4364(+)
MREEVVQAAMTPLRRCSHARAPIALTMAQTWTASGPSGVNGANARRLEGHADTVTRLAHVVSRRYPVAVEPCASLGHRAKWLSPRTALASRSAVLTANGTTGRSGACVPPHAEVASRSALAISQSRKPSAELLQLEAAKSTKLVEQSTNAKTTLIASLEIGASGRLALAHATAPRQGPEVSPLMPLALASSAMAPSLSLLGATPVRTRLHPLPAKTALDHRTVFSQTGLIGHHVQLHAVQDPQCDPGQSRCRHLWMAWSAKLRSRR